MSETIEQNIPICKHCDAPMEPSSFDGKYIQYVCPNQCEFKKSIELIIDLTDEDLEYYANMESPKPYENHCWYCKAPISSETCKPDPIPGNGYICNICGKSLREWKAFMYRRSM